MPVRPPYGRTTTTLPSELFQTLSLYFLMSDRLTPKKVYKSLLTSLRSCFGANVILSVLGGFDTLL